MGACQSIGPSPEFAAMSLISELRWHQYMVEVWPEPNLKHLTSVADHLLMGIVFVPVISEDDPIRFEYNFRSASSRNPYLSSNRSEHDSLIRPSSLLSSPKIWKLREPFHWKGTYSLRNGCCRVELHLDHQLLHGYGPTLNLALVNLLTKILDQTTDPRIQFQIEQLFQTANLNADANLFMVNLHDLRTSWWLKLFRYRDRDYSLNLILNNTIWTSELK